MVAIQPTADPNGRYSIGETCAILGIHRNSLRKYTEEGAIKCGHRKNFRKFYTGLEIIKFWSSCLR